MAGNARYLEEEQIAISPIWIAAVDNLLACGQTPLYVLSLIHISYDERRVAHEAIFIDFSVPVSYTHLEQGFFELSEEANDAQNWFDPVKLKELRAEALKTARRYREAWPDFPKIDVKKAESLGPVSYTHLDVYKRQLGRLVVGG